MTSQEARQKVDSCEQQITSTYSNLLNAAKSMGSSASQAASSKTTKSTFLPLIISLIGLIFSFSHIPVFGIILIIAGIVVAYNKRQSAASVQKKVEQQVQYLNNALNSNLINKI